MSQCSHILPSYLILPLSFFFILFFPIFPIVLPLLFKFISPLLLIISPIQLSTYFSFHRLALQSFASTHTDFNEMHTFRHFHSASTCASIFPNTHPLFTSCEDLEVASPVRSPIHRRCTVVVKTFMVSKAIFKLLLFRLCHALTSNLCFSGQSTIATCVEYISSFFLIKVFRITSAIGQVCVSIVNLRLGQLSTRRSKTAPGGKFGTTMFKCVTKRQWQPEPGQQLFGRPKSTLLWVKISFIHSMILISASLLELCDLVKL